METYIASKSEMQEEMKNAIEEWGQKNLPRLLRKAQRKEWMTVKELADLTGWSRRTIYYLKSEDRIPYSQENHRILFPTDGIEEYLRSNLVEPNKEVA